MTKPLARPMVIIPLLLNITAFTDVFGFFSFLGLATLLIRFLL